MRKEIIVISDLWGEKKSDWSSLFKEFISDDISLKFYDACQLGQINLALNDEKQIHSQFVEFGIENAVKELLAKEHVVKTYIGCSVGGVIAWKAALRGLKMDRLITISSTRLRYETQKPDCEVMNYFGLADRYRPKFDWLESLGKETTKLIPGGHEIYNDRSLLVEIFDVLKPIG